MKRGRDLEVEVFEELKKRNFHFEKCGLYISVFNPIFGASPDGIREDAILEIKCPSTKKTFSNYICDGAITEKYKEQMLLQMFITNREKGLFCVADPEFEKNKRIHTLWIDSDKVTVEKLIQDSSEFWKENIYPILLNSFCNH